MSVCRQSAASRLANAFHSSDFACEKVWPVHFTFSISIHAIFLRTNRKRKKIAARCQTFFACDIRFLRFLTSLWGFRERYSSCARFFPGTMDFLEEEMVAILYRKQRQRLCVMQLMILSSRKRRHRFWVHEILRKRKEHGAFCYLVRELQLDAERHHEYFRMSAENWNLFSASSVL